MLPTKSNQVRVLLEAILSADIALLAIPVLSLRSKYPILLAGRWLLYFAEAHARFVVPRRNHGDPYAGYFLVLVLVTATILFLMLRLAARFGAVTKVLRIAPGFVAVVGLPVSLWLIEHFPAILLLEILAAALCTFMYVVGRWKVSPYIGTLLLLLHFVFWAWGTRGVLWFWPIYPALGFCCVVVWALYMRGPGLRLDSPSLATMN
jgi:hypothetical protein